MTARCPKCNSVRQRVVDTRDRNNLRWRKRKCIACNHKWETYEVEARVIDRLDRLVAEGDRMVELLTSQLEIWRRNI